jgi:feruloyl-CoA synthase
VTRIVHINERADGTIDLKPEAVLAPYPRTLTERLEHWALTTPDRTLVARRGRDGGVEASAWQTLSYAQVWHRVRGLAAQLLPLQLSVERPVAILSGNSVEHLLLGLACMVAGVPYCPVSASYSTLASDHRKLRFVLELLTPGLVAAFCDDDRSRSSFERAIGAAVPPGTLVLSNAPLKHDRTIDQPLLDWHAWLASAMQPASAAGNAQVDRQVVADFRLHRPAQGGHHHAAHVVQQSTNDCDRDAVSRRRAGVSRLVAVESCLRRQPQCRHRSL